MKNLLSTLLFVLSICSVAYSQTNDEKYQQVMRKNIALIYAADSIPSYQRAVNAFQRIAAAEPERWEPHYYAAFGFIMMGNLANDGAQKDNFLDQAVGEIAKAREAVQEESEIDALEGFAYMIRVTVDPASRGAQLAPLAMKYYQKALSLNPDNPRAMALLAQMQYGTAQFFGSPVAEACGTARAAVQKFEAVKDTNSLAPTWGKAMADSMVSNCQ